jgi:hypothetical protein
MRGARENVKEKRKGRKGRERERRRKSVRFEFEGREDSRILKNFLKF